MVSVWVGTYASASPIKCFFSGGSHLLLSFYVNMFVRDFRGQNVIKTLKLQHRLNVIDLLCLPLCFSVQEHMEWC